MDLHTEVKVEARVLVEISSIKDSHALRDLLDHIDPKQFVDYNGAPGRLPPHRIKRAMELRYRLLDRLPHDPAA